ncbi:AmpG family muropeptide MFS transporter [Stutzerimonas kirkiae]|uniref:AmpG family muropeptide MFS transporter n=1 Tax=Stutzerimonas kirkiae TaxID=2211392 RepID=A0A4Q9RC90_9GAMM|nr:AmpG family muropeptide MFS transporter [Stutzerimonas kirkiae]TBU98398.1 AmpG family muropeptide MFS transporter [Stutzerimonas kirkiae]TBU98459.1 AmpG family muropeptide MFS transporter [Stutzerimonas kirkiae]TBV06933.1 AmpG family muropeptide MFS transporter [Stutzerimonas kirkiae]TBV16204.1 AmpG family muropeptide MFS transporter [Stutzerimonas kirkiae]
MPRETWRDAIAAYASPATLALLLLGFAAGLPAILVFSTLSVWLREAGVSRETIGFASWISLAYAFKWVWSPMLDQWRLPWIGRLGKRRSWLVLSQSLIALGLVGMALCNPQHNLGLLIALAVVVAFSSATQDIAIDAYRLEIAEQKLQATLAASYMTGYRIAMLLASAGALFLAEWLGSSNLEYNQAAWSTTYLLFALLILPGLLTSLLIPEPPAAIPLSNEPSCYSFNHQFAAVGLLLVLLISIPAMINALIAQAWPRALLYALFILGSLSPMGRTLLVPVRRMLGEAARRQRPERFDFVHQAVSVLVLIILMVSSTGMCQSYWGGYWPRGTMYLLICWGCLSAPGRILMGPVLTPITDFILRYRWEALLLLGLIATYRMSDTVMGVMANVFYIDQGFSKDQIASVSKLFGLVMTLLGAAIGGLLIVRFSILPILFIGGLASAATNLLFMLLVDMGAHLNMLILTISFDNFSAGLASTAFVAYLSSLTNLKFSATQYAMLSSLMLLLPRLLGGYSGVMVEKIGYSDFFLVTALLGVPTLVLIVWQWCRTRADEGGQSARR